MIILRDNMQLPSKHTLHHSSSRVISTWGNTASPYRSVPSYATIYTYTADSSNIINIQHYFQINFYYRSQIL